jgi:hypothetical protein
MERVYEKVEHLIKSVVDAHTQERHARSIMMIEMSLRNLYTNQDIFKKVMERYYSDPRNPFTTAYSQFMNYLDSGINLDEIYWEIAECILLRRLKEKQTGNIYTVFK